METAVTAILVLLLVNTVSLLLSVTILIYFYFQWKLYLKIDPEPCNEPPVVGKVTAGQLIKKKNKFSINDDENIALREINERRTSIKRTHF